MGLRPGTRVGQRAEWLTPRLVLLCEPSMETLLGMLGASSSNYLHPFSLAGAQAEHRQFRGALQSIGTKVLDLREALATNSEEDPQARGRLEQWARASTSYDFGDALVENDRAEAEAHFTRTIEKLDALDLADLILLRPTVRIQRRIERGEASLASRYELAPLSNAHYMRDPLTTTPAGCIIGRLSLEVRSQETEVAAFALEQLGVTPIYHIKAPGTLEGGDFIPCDTFVLQGQGVLSNAEGVAQCLEARAYGFVEVAVVHDPHAIRDEMHLDSYFTVFDADLCALCEDRFEADAPRVDVYLPEGTEADFTYRLARNVPLPDYLEGHGMRVLRFSRSDLEHFAPNGLLLGRKIYLGVSDRHSDWETRLMACGVSTHMIDFGHLGGGYGGPHCQSQVLVRA